MENGAFFAGIAIAPELPLMAELAVAMDVILIAVIVGVLTRDIQQTIGTTEAAALSELKEELIHLALTVVVSSPVRGPAVWLAPFREAAWAITVACLSLTCVLALVVTAKVISNGRVTGIARWIEFDGLGALILALVTLVCLLAAIFAGGYMRREHSGKNHLWWFYCNYNLFVFALVAVPSLADPNLVWVAVELVTLFSVLLVA